MHSFVPGPALLGGALLGGAAGLLMVTTGRCAGISGILDGALRRDAPPWRWAFLAGLLLAGVALQATVPASVPGLPLSTGAGQLVVAGLAVGFGARVGGGCTSGHGVVGTSRLSPRSLVATAVFIATGFATVGLLRVLRG